LFIAEGILFTLLGILGMALPQFFSLTLDYFFGWLFILGAVALGYRSIATPDMPNRTASIFSSILYLVLGILLFVYPMSGILTLTLLLAFYFFLDGVVKVYGAFQIKPLKSWGWILTSGVLSLILAALILGLWPSQASWILGMLVGINLFITGVTTLGFIWSLSKE
ncbi:MAG: DUF308 domain-containing protein, partial [Verrucomicrobia bacterium]|nr:DUF308 domain-containing protein [Verrucomicrobiota bacterium]